MSTEVSRRSFLKGTTVAALGALAATNLAACGKPKASADTQAASASAQAQPSFLRAPETITNFAETKEFDVVVVGAGESGLSAVHSALKTGSKVACVQNLSVPQTTGNMAASIDLSKTSEAGVQACLSFVNWRSDNRSNRALVESWARNSFEAIGWWADEAAKKGVESKPHDAVLSYHGQDIHLHANTYFHVEGNHNAAATVIAETLAAEGAEFFYSHPCVQLHKEGEAVTGVICETSEKKHVLFKARKGVIIACGDYTSNPDMLQYYAPDTQGFQPSTTFRDGKALLAGMWAGAVMTPHTHTKMIHGEPAPVRLEMPFLFVDGYGKRFMDETCCRMGYINNYMRPYMRDVAYGNDLAAKFFSIVPGNWESYVDGWKAKHPYDISIYNAYRKVDPSKWVTADTIEGLAQAMVEYAQKNKWPLIPDPAEVVKSINRYNELCQKGADEDFGKSSEFMVPITAPFYAVPRGSNRVSAILGGLVTDGSYQCLTETGDPIKGLYAVGNACGQFYGGVDYPMDIEGLSIGRAITSGYVAGKIVGSL